MSNLEIAVRKQIPSVPKALAALDVMGKALTSAKTYDDIKRVIKEARAIKILMDDIVEVRHRAEDVLTDAEIKIGEEYAKVEKIGGPGRGKERSRRSDVLGKAATGIPGSTGRRLAALAKISKATIERIKKKLRAEGKAVNARAIKTALDAETKGARRAAKEKATATKIKALPQKRFGIVVADPEWKFKVRSENGEDRSARNHYSTSELADIKARDVASIAAKDCILFLWATVPMLKAALDVMEEWGFTYVSHYVQPKPKTGTGYWSLNQHELLLVGTRGRAIAPLNGAAWGSSILPVFAGRHSEKPESVLEKIETIWPNLPKIELNRRGAARPGWEAWGAEVED